MSDSLSCLVIIPTYQESENIENVLTQVRSAFPSGHVLVVDDNSPDGTADPADKLSERLGNINILRRPGKDGLGSAYRAGFEWGFQQGYDVVIEMDADLSHDPGALPSLVRRIEEGADLVVGSRYVPGGAIPGWPAHRALLSRYGNTYARMMLKLTVDDATSGYRAYRSSLFETLDLDAVRADGYGFQIEMVYRMTRAGAVVREIPITFVDRTEGQSKMSGRIIVEALGLVTLWGVRDRVNSVLAFARARRKHRSR